jgi:hypothetical protein
LSGLLANQAQSVGFVIDTFDKERILRKDDRLDEFIENHIDTYDNVKNLPLSQLLSYYKYQSGLRPQPKNNINN